MNIDGYIIYIYIESIWVVGFILLTLVALALGLYLGYSMTDTVMCTVDKIWSSCCAHEAVAASQAEERRDGTTAAEREENK